jgi:hypothetical protein
MSAEFAEQDPIRIELEKRVSELRAANVSLFQENQRVPPDPYQINEAKRKVSQVEEEITRIHVEYDLDHYRADHSMVIKGLVKSLWPFSRKGNN